MQVFEDPYALNARHSRQANIHQSYVGQIAADAFQSLFHRAKRIRATVSWGAIDEESQAFADVAPIFDNGYLDCGWPCRRGNWRAGHLVRHAAPWDQWGERPYPTAWHA